MPEFSEKSSHTAAKAPLPEQKARGRAQQIPQPQIAPAEAEAGPEPAEKELRPDEKLAEHRGPAVQGTEKIRRRSQQEACQKAAGQLVPYKTGIQRSNPRFRPPPAS